MYSIGVICSHWHYLFLRHPYLELKNITTITIHFCNKYMISYFTSYIVCSWPNTIFIWSVHSICLSKFLMGREVPRANSPHVEFIHHIYIVLDWLIDWLIVCCLTSSRKYVMHIQDEYHSRSTTYCVTNCIKML